MSIETNVAETNVAETVVPVKPIGNKALLRWYVPLARAGKTLAEVHEEYGVDLITRQSLSVKLSNLRKWAEKQGIRDVPQLRRVGGGRSSEDVDAEALAAELNLGFLLGDEADETDETDETVESDESAEVTVG